MSDGKVNCLVGDMGSGKTTFVTKNFCEKTKREILCYLRVRSDFPIKRAKVFTNFMDFIATANTKTNCIFFIDEAFTCLPKRLNIRPDKPDKIDNQLADFLVNARKLNNFVFIVYHSLNQVPTDWLISYLDYFVRFRTNDLMQYQFNRFSSFPNIIRSLQEKNITENFVYDVIKIR